MNSNTTPKADVYTRVNDKIVTALEAGVRPWMQPRTVEHAGKNFRPMRSNGKPYLSFNGLLLSIEAIDMGIAPISSELLRPLSSAVVHREDFYTALAHAVRQDVRIVGHDQFAGTFDPAGSSQVWVGLQNGDALANFRLQRAGGVRVILGDVEYYVTQIPTGRFGPFNSH
jgi:hypothetical protein